MKVVSCMLVALVSFALAQLQWEEAPPPTRWLFDQLRFGDPRTGRIPPDAAVRDQWFAAAYVRSAYSKQPTIASTLVEPIGPVNVAGRIRALAIDVRSPNVLMTGGVSGGIWRSIDRGQSWALMTPPTLVPQVSCIAQSVLKPSTWYVGTGEGLSTTERRTSTQLRTIGTGTGIYRSTDDGVTWERISPQPTAEPNTVPAQAWQIVWRLAPLVRNGREVLFAACYGGIYAWEGTSWKLAIGDTVRPPFNTEVLAAGNRLYAAIGATEDGQRPPQYGIFMLDDSGNWQNITPPNFPTVRRIVLAASSDGAVLYAFTEAPADWSERYNTFASYHTLWRYDAAQSSWTDLRAWVQKLSSSEPSWLTLGGYAMALTVHPRNPAVVYVAGTDLYASHDGCVATRYHLGGYPYTVEAGALHPDVHAIVFDPHDAGVLYVATDGGIYRTTEPLAQSEVQWEALNNGLLTTQAYHVAIDKATADDRFIIAGFQDNSNWYTLSATYGVPWTFAGGGDGCRVLVAPRRSVIVASSQFGSVYALRIDPAGMPQFIQLPKPPRSGSMFVTEVAYDAANKQLFLALDNQLYSIALDSASVGSSWILRASLPSSQLISSMALCNSSSLLLGTATGKLYRYDLATGQLQPLAAPLPPGGFIAAIDCDPVDPQRTVVTVSNYTLPSIFATWDGGTTWQSVGGTLDEEVNGWGPSVRVVRVLYRNGKRLYIAGTSIGAFVTDSLHAATVWQPFGRQTLGTLPVEAIEVRHSDGFTVIGSHGGGIFACTLDPSAGGSEQEVPPTDFFAEQPFPNPAHDYAAIRVHVPRSEGMLSVQLYDLLGRLLIERRMPIAAAGTVTVTLTATELSRLTAGAYFYRVQWHDRVVSGTLLKAER